MFEVSYSKMQQKVLGLLFSVKWMDIQKHLIFNHEAIQYNYVPVKILFNYILGPIPLYRGVT